MQATIRSSGPRWLQGLRLVAMVTGNLAGLAALLGLGLCWLVLLAAAQGA